MHGPEQLSTRIPLQHALFEQLVPHGGQPGGHYRRHAKPGVAAWRRRRAGLFAHRQHNTWPRVRLRGQVRALSGRVVPVRLKLFPIGHTAFIIHMLLPPPPQSPGRACITVSWRRCSASALKFWRLLSGSRRNAGSRLSATAVLASYSAARQQPPHITGGSSSRSSSSSSSRSSNSSRAATALAIGFPLTQVETTS